MKTAIPIVLSVLLLVLPALSGTPDDHVIVPGSRIGTWMLRMTIDDLAKVNGPASTRPVQNSDMFRSVTECWWSSGAPVAGTFDGHKIVYLVTGAMGESISYKTDKGLGQRSTLAEVRKAYGRPTAETMPMGGPQLLYDRIGIGFQFRGETMHLILIFPPGTARSIWKF
jgi:hypothetical protein